MNTDLCSEQQLIDSEYTLEELNEITGTAKILAALNATKIKESELAS